MMSKAGQPRKYTETMSCRVTVYFTPSQYEELFGVIGTTGDASCYLRNLFLERLSSALPNNNGLINSPVCTDNERD